MEKMPKEFVNLVEQILQLAEMDIDLALDVVKRDPEGVEIIRLFEQYQEYLNAK